MDDEIDVVITGHTNWAVNCVIDGKVVTGAASQGRVVTDIDAKFDPATGDFVANSILVNNRIVTQNVTQMRPCWPSSMNTTRSWHRSPM